MTESRKILTAKEAKEVALLKIEEQVSQMLEKAQWQLDLALSQGRLSTIVDIPARLNTQRDECVEAYNVETRTQFIKVMEDLGYEARGADGDRTHTRFLIKWD